MKLHFNQTLLFALFTFIFTACSSNNNDPIGSFDELAVETDLKNNEISAKGGSFFLQIRATGQWNAICHDSWCVISNRQGNGNATTICSISANNGAERHTTITVTSGGESRNIIITQKEGNGENPDPDPNPDPEQNPDSEPRPSGYAGRIEVPALNKASNNLFVTHTTQVGGKEVITYSFEYDCSKKSSRWVAFTFNASTPNNGVGRAGKFGDDPKIPSQYRTHDDDYKGSGYSRGHLVASSDRQYSVSANKQTFYMSNMNPQIQDGFNGGIWLDLERKVQEWGNITNNQDTLYVAKGGTIDNNNIIEYIKDKIPVPKYFFMAILSLKNGQYKAIGFWFEHKAYSRNDYASYAVSIDDLEEKTGIDFFHNLPNSIEDEVELSYNKSSWGL